MLKGNPVFKKTSTLVTLIMLMVFAFSASAFAAKLPVKDLTKSKILDQKAYPTIKSQAITAAVKKATSHMGKSMINKAEIKLNKWSKTIEMDVTLIDTKMKSKMIYRVTLQKKANKWVTTAVKSLTKETKGMHKM